MDILDEELLKFWRALQQQQVQFIMVGGFAVILHGYNRATGDVDIWIKDTLDNRKLLRKAFEECGMGDYPMIEYMEFIPGWTNFYIGKDMYLDILIDMKGLEGYTFDECLQMASIADIEDVQIPFLHINQLIENKRVINRPKDQLDVLALEEIKKLREEN